MNIRLYAAHIWCYANSPIYWCWLVPDVRYFGPREDYHDGSIYSFGFWWFHGYSFGYDVDE